MEARGWEQKFQQQRFIKVASLGWQKGTVLMAPKAVGLAHRLRTQHYKTPGLGDLGVLTTHETSP